MENVESKLFYSITVSQFTVLRRQLHNVKQAWNFVHITQKIILRNTLASGKKDKGFSTPREVYSRKIIYCWILVIISSASGVDSAYIW